MKKTLLIITLSLCALCTRAQVLKPGFDPEEYIDMLLRCAGAVTSAFFGTVPHEVNYTTVYSSPEMGLHNKYQIWLNKSKTVMAINLRGTTGNLDSWAENLYSAMIPATGSLKLSDSFTFNYKFANDPLAMVHVGWAVGVGSLAPDIMDKLMVYYRQGIKQVIVEGHSQGGALAFLLTSYLHYQIEAGNLPKDLVIKTYCSAAPKPGNQHYAYDFDNMTLGGWAFTVVNAADWVPETPFSLQCVTDFNATSPFTHAKKGLRSQKNLLVRLYTTHIYNQLNRASRKGQRKFRKRLGRTVYKQIKKFIPGFEQPEYTNSFNYARAGCPIVLVPDAEYYKHFPQGGTDIFRNHLFEPYIYLVKNTFK